MLKVCRPAWALSAFEPYISRETMYVHVDQLHKGYVDKLNANMDRSILTQDPSQVLSNLNSYLPWDKQQFYRNMMGGNVAHTLFWKSISPNADTSDFNVSFTDMSTNQIRHAVVNAGVERFGSGWVWGVITQEGVFRIYSTRDHDTPYMRGHLPIFCVDVWEHAYFLDQHGHRKAWLENACAFIDFKAIEHYARTPRILDSWVLGR